MQNQEPESHLQHRWDALLRVMPDLVFWMTPDGVHTDFHASDMSRLAISPSAIIGSNVRDVLPPLQADAAMAAIGRTIGSGATETFQYTLEIDGKQQHLEARALAVQGEVVALVRDITVQIEAQRTASQVTKYFEALLDDSFELIVVTDDAGLVQYVSSAASAALGYEPEALIGTGFHQYVHPEDLLIALEALDRLRDFVTGQGPVEIRILDAQHGWRICEVNAANLLRDPDLNALVFHLRDVTQRLVAQRRFRFLFETHPMPSAYLPPNQGGIIANRAFTKLFGYDSPNEIEAVLPASLLAPEERDITVHNLLTGLENNQQFGCEITAMRRDGSIFPAQLWASIATETDDAGAILVAVDDLTEVRSAQAQVAAQQLELAVTRDQRDSAELEARHRKAQRLESVGRLAAGVAHDFTNLLGVALNYASAIERGALDEEQRDDLAQIQLSLEIAAELAQRLLQFGRADTAAAGTFNIGRHLPELRAILDNITGRAVPVEIEVLVEDLIVAADSAQIDRVIMNLVMNASEAIADGGTIRVVLDSCETTLPSVRLRVIDNGRGMAAAVIENAFDPFFTTREQGMGTGLGLAVVDGIVGAAGGTVTIESQVGIGTTVTVLLPCADVVNSVEG